MKIGAGRQRVPLFGLGAGFLGVLLGGIVLDPLRLGADGGMGGALSDQPCRRSLEQRGDFRRRQRFLNTTTGRGCGPLRRSSASHSGGLA